MTEIAERPLAVLAFDHREGAFASVRPGGMTHDEIRASKSVVFEAFEAAVAAGLGDAGAGVLVDEQFAAPLARQARANGVTLLMPVERADEDVFTLEYGPEFREHLLEFRPDYAKALVRYSSSDPTGANAVQLARLRQVSDFLVDSEIKFMFELIVGTSGTDEEGERPLVVDVEDLCASMRQILDAGIRVDTWKVQGMGSPDDAAEVARTAATSDHPSTCVVLGAGAPVEAIEHWLDVAAATPGFSGFAIGRSIWGGPITAWLDGTIAREDAVERIASTYRACTLRYMGTRVG